MRKNSKSKDTKSKGNLWCIRIDLLMDLSKCTKSDRKAYLHDDFYDMIYFAERFDMLDYYFTIYNDVTEETNQFSTGLVKMMSDAFNNDSGNMVYAWDKVYVAGMNFIDYDNTTSLNCDRIILYDSRQEDQSQEAHRILKSSDRSSKVVKVCCHPYIDLPHWRTIVGHSTNGFWKAIGIFGEVSVIPDIYMEYASNLEYEVGRQNNVAYTCRYGRNLFRETFIANSRNDDEADEYTQNFAYHVDLMKKYTKEDLLAGRIKSNKRKILYINMQYESEELSKCNLLSLLDDDPDYVVDSYGELHVNPHKVRLDITITGCEHVKCVSGSRNVKVVRFGRGVKRIDTHAFMGANSLKEIFIGPDVEEISESAFEGCPRVRKIHFSEARNLRKIGEYAFNDCMIDSIDLSNCTSLKEIHRNVFCSYMDYKYVVLPESLEYMSPIAIIHTQRLDISRCTHLKSTKFIDEITADELITQKN